MTQTARWLLTMACSLLSLCSLNAAAQSWPVRPVRMVVPYAPGGGPDVLARRLGQYLSDSLGQQFIVDNRPGAGGIAAAEITAKAPPDGYLMFFSDIQQLAINPAMFSRLSYDPLRDFAPVSLAGSIPLFIVAQASLPVNNLAELVSYARANPGKLTYGSSGVGSIHHIAMESLKASLGIDVVHVPYKGAGQSVPAFLGGEVPLVVSAYTALANHVKTGKVKLIAVTSSNRVPQAPEAGAVAELVAGFNYSSEMGVVMPAGTPPEIIQKLSGEIGRGLNSPDIARRLNTMGVVTIASSPEAYAQNIRANLQQFARAVKVSGATVE